MERQTSFQRKKMTKQYTARRDDSTIQAAARDGNLESVSEILNNCTDEEELKGLLVKQNQSGETVLYVAAENGRIDLVTELVKYYDVGTARIKARNGFDAFHVAAKQGHLDVLKVLMDQNLELSMTVDSTNTTALYTAAAQGHFEVVNFLLENCGHLAAVTRNNGKTALHSAARNGHLEVVNALLNKEQELGSKCDNKGQTPLHMAVKGQRTDIVEALMSLSVPAVVNVVDKKGNTALHIATRKARSQIVLKLLNCDRTDKTVVNKSGETALDIAEKSSYSEIASVLQSHGVRSAKSITPAKSQARELKQTVSDIKHEVHDQLEHTRQTRKRVQGIAKRLDKMHSEGLNNAINSTTVVAVLIATVAFAAIFTVPGQYVDNPKDVQKGFSLGEANIASNPAFSIFFIFDSFALFISLAVVVVQTSVVVVERKAKKQLMAVINKLMWCDCVMVSVAYLALSYIVVGNEGRWLAVFVTAIGTVIMATTLGTMCYWIVMHRIEASKLKSMRRSSNASSRSRSWSVSDSDILNNECKKVYAI